MKDDRLTSVFIYRLSKVRAHAFRKDLTLKEYINDLIEKDMEETD